MIHYNKKKFAVADEVTKKLGEFSAEMKHYVKGCGCGVERGVKKGCSEGVLRRGAKKGC